MATDPAWIDSSAGSPAYSGQELRLNALLPMLAGAGASLGVQSGVRASGSATDLLVQAQASPNMTVKVNPGAFVGQGAISSTQGPYCWTLDVATNLTIAAAHATLSRTDRIVVRIRDANVDTSGQRDGNVVVITGTAGGGVPSLPTDASYFEIARIAVGAAVSSIVAGNITDKRTFTAALGGVIPCNATTEPSASSVAPGQNSWRTDLGYQRASNQSVWAPVQQNYVASVARTTNNGGITTVELVIDSVTFTAIAGRRYKVTWMTSVQVNAASNNVEIRLRYAAGSSVTSAGTLFGGTIHTSAGSGVSTPICLTKDVTGIAAGQTTIGALMIITFGSGTATSVAAANYPSELLIEDIGV